MDRCDLTILGDRQTGKTYMLTSMAVDAAVNGEDVWYHTRNHQMAHEILLRCVDRIRWLYPDKLERAYYTNGSKRIKFKGGGQIKFYPGADQLFRKCDLEILDESTAERSPLAKRSIRAVLR